jgi:hypothetical protein
MSGWGRTGRRVALIRMLATWKSGAGNPTDEDGNATPLKSLSLASASMGKIVHQWECNAKTDHVALADEIMQTCEEFTNEISLSGEEQIYVLNPFFGSSRQPGPDFPIRITPMPRIEGPDKFAATMDLRDPRNRESTAMRESMSLTREAWQLVAGTMRINLESLERQNGLLAAENASLKADRENNWRLTQQLMDQDVARKQTERKNEIQLKTMETAAGKVLSYLPLITARLDQYMAKKFGVEDGKADSVRDGVKNLVGKLNEGNVPQIIELLKLSPSEIAWLMNVGREVKADEHRRVMQVEAGAALKGIILPFAQLPRRLATGTTGEAPKQEST